MPVSVIKNARMWTVLGLLLLSFLIFRMFQSHASGFWFSMATHPELMRLLDDAGNDLKNLARLDPDNGARYRARFDRVQEARRNMMILVRSKDRLVSRYELFLLSGMALVITISLLHALAEQRRTHERLAAIRVALERLAQGEDVGTNTRWRGILGRIGRMIEETAAVLGRQRKRIATLDNLRDWQHAARRIAHEIRTPLATMAFTSERLPDPQREILREEIGRLRHLAYNFASFAGIGSPDPRPESARLWLLQLGEIFGEAWPGVRLETVFRGEDGTVSLDRAMARQVITNLCQNAAHALRDRDNGLIRLEGVLEGSRFIVHVHDNGPGIDPRVREQIFQPYVSSRKGHGGLGLGLAIARKIMLEHGGDLDLVSHDTEGTCFCLWFPQEGSE